MARILAIVTTSRGSAHRLLALGALVAVTTTLTRAATAQSAPSDPIAAGYHLLWSGDKVAALRHFEKLLESHPNDLPARFGWLMVQNDRVDVDDSVQPALERGLDGFIDLATARYDRNKQDAEALLYTAQAHLLRATYRFDHDKGLWGAARDGAKAKGYIDTYVKEHPETGDAYFVLGVYNYYADLAPTFFKALRFMLFVPPGNRVEGLKQIERAASQGALFGPRAQLLLVELYSTLEGRPAEAVTIGERLQSQYPASDDVDFAMADLYSSPSVENFERAARAYQEVIDRRRSDSSLEGSTARYRALFGLSNARFSEWRIEESIAALSPPIDAGVRNPAWVLPQFLLRRGNYRALLNDTSAEDDDRRILADAKLTKWHTAANDQLKWMRERNASGEAAFYAVMIPANRLVADGKWDEARSAYEAIRARNPQSPHVLYRLAYLDFARGDAERALPAMTALAANPKNPEGVRANAWLYIGRAHDLAGRREEARKAYQKVVDDFEKQRAAEAARIGLITPYRRPVK
jgi:tetratricopeptide (TPR) repeat protein